MLDGTPLLDIKPYVPDFDVRTDVKTGWYAQTEQGITMSNLTKILMDGAVLSLFVSLWMLLALWINPRIFLHDYPAKIQEIVPQRPRLRDTSHMSLECLLMLLLLLGPFFSTLSLKSTWQCTILDVLVECCRGNVGFQYRRLADFRLADILYPYAPFCHHPWQ